MAAVALPYSITGVRDDVAAALHSVLTPSSTLADLSCKLLALYAAFPNPKLEATFAAPLSASDKVPFSETMLWVPSRDQLFALNRCDLKANQDVDESLESLAHPFSKEVFIFSLRAGRLGHAPQFQSFSLPRCGDRCLQIRLELFPATPFTIPQNNSKKASGPGLLPSHPLASTPHLAQRFSRLCEDAHWEDNPSECKLE